MAVRQFKDGRWFVYYRKRGPDGKSKVKWEPFGRGPEAEAKARQRDKELGLAQRRPAAQATGPTFLEIALAYLKRRGPNENSRKQLRIRLDAHLIPFFGGRIALRVRPSDVKAYIDAREKEGVSMSTIARELTDLKAIYSWATGLSKHKDKPDPPILSSNPLAGVPKPQVRHTPRRPPTLEEAMAIMDAAEDHVRRSIYLGWYLGCRPGRVETFSIRWTDVRWKSKTVMITSAHKGGPEAREVAIHPELMPLLNAWWQADGKGAGYIVNWCGKRVGSIKHAWAKTLQRVRKAQAKRLGVKPESLPLLKAVPYDLRHHFVTRALEAGGDLGAIAKVVGSSPMTLMRFYQHVSTELTRKTVALDTVFV